MQTVTLFFLHPSEQTYLPISVDVRSSLYQIAESVINTGFVPSNPNGYHLAIGNQTITANYSAVDLNLPDQTLIRIVPNPVRKANSVNFGTGKKAAMDNAFQVTQSPQVAHQNPPKTAEQGVFWQFLKSFIGQ